MKKIVLISLLSLLGQAFAMEQKQPNNQAQQLFKNQLLAQAVSNNNGTDVQQLLDEGANPNTLIHNPTVGQLSVTEQAIVQANAQPTVNVNYAILRALIKAGANLETRNFEGHTPLIRVVYENNVELAKELLRGKADVNAKSMRSQSTALDYASRNKSYLAMELLIGFGAHITRSMDRQVIVRNEKPNQELINFFIDAATDNSAITIRESFDLSPVLHYLLQQFYAKFSSIDQLKSFYKNLEHTSDDQSDEVTLFQRINHQINKNFNVHESDSKAQTPLYFALINGDEYMVKRLLDLGVEQIRTKMGRENISAKVSLSTPSTQNPLCYVLKQLRDVHWAKNLYPDYAAKYETYLSILELLLNYNPDIVPVEINFSDSDRYQTVMTPKDFAKEHNLEEVIELLDKKRLSLKRITAKNIICSVLNGEEDVIIPHVSTLPKELVADLRKEINKHISIANYKSHQEGHITAEQLKKLKDALA